MKLLKMFKPEKCVSKDENRNVLNYLFVEKISDTRGVVCATTGALLVRIPVELMPEDKEGCVPVEAFQCARQVYADKDEFFIALRDKAVIESKDCRAEYDRFKHLTFPKTGAIFPKGKVLSYISLNAKALKAVADALGSEEIILEIRGSEVGVVVRTAYDDAGMGLIMPLKIEKNMEKGQQTLSV